MSARQILEAELTWTGRRFESGVQIAIEEGRIAAVGRELGTTHQRLDRRALLPGFVNSHSHAFQRGLRGEGETFPEAAGSFWTWRQAMYALVQDLDPEKAFKLSKQAFTEMRSAGFTTVGEFHYIHHRRPEDLDFSLDDAILAAAREAEIRLVLLQTFYRRGGFRKELEGAQRRFATPDLDGYWKQFEALAARLGPLQTMGVVAHSLRAAEPEEIRLLARRARELHLPLHLHLEEQVLEVEDCVAAHGKRPAEVLYDTLEGDLSGVTAVHCTSTPAEWLERLTTAGMTICSCPLTEGNLGDGIPALVDAPSAWERLAIGTDSNLRIDPLEELRWLDYGQRLTTRSRGALRRPDGEVASLLLAAATSGGARALGLAGGRIAPGCVADFIAVDLDRPSLSGVRPERLGEALIYGAGSAAICATAVGGVWREH
jgi:formimidoylglutamate deiminase